MGSRVCNLGQLDWISEHSAYWGNVSLSVPLQLGIESKNRTQDSPCAAASGASLKHADRQSVRDQLERIMASDAFRGSKRSREFLAHIAEKTLDAEGDLLKERLIGVHLYGKDRLLRHQR